MLTREENFGHEGSESKRSSNEYLMLTSFFHALEMKMTEVRSSLGGGSGRVHPNRQSAVVLLSAIEVKITGKGRPARSRQNP
jgi:hypothetical protein